MLGWKVPSLSVPGTPLPDVVNASAERPENTAMTFLLLAVSRFVMPPTADVGVSAPPRIAAAALAVASAPPTVWSTFSDSTSVRCASSANEDWRCSDDAREIANSVVRMMAAATGVRISASILPRNEPNRGMLL